MKLHFGTGFAPSNGRSGVLGVAMVLLLIAPVLADAVPSVGVTVLENGADRIVLQYDFNEFASRLLDVDGRSYLSLTIPHEPLWLGAGEPAVPYVVRSVAIPAGSDVNVRLLDGRYADQEGVQLISGKGNLLRTVDPASVPYTFGPAYQTDAFFPGQLVESHEPYVLRDVQGVAVAVYPVQYNAGTGTLRVYSTMTVEITPFAARDVAETGIREDRSLSQAFYDLYRLHFVNYDLNQRYAPLDETGNLLVICYDAWLPNVQPLVTHKNSIGIATTAVGVSTIGNNATAIKNYIQNLYNTSDLAFVILVGDSTQVATPTASGGAADPTYAKVAGGDNYPDIMIGRLSAETPAHVDTQVQRTVEYEVNQYVLQSWFKKGVGVASNQGAGQGDEGQADNVHMAEIRTWLLAAGYTVVDEVYDPTGTKAMITNALNQGRGIINYCGHGSTTSWGTTGFSNTDVAALQNDNKLPFITSVACVNGQFNGYTCFAEAWMRSTRAGEPIGAIGVYMSSINQSWAPPMEAEDEFNLLLTNPNPVYHCYGTFSFAGSCSMMDDYGSGGVDMFNTWHIFGDPSLRIVGTTAPPTGLGVTPGSGLNAQGPQGGPFSPSGITYTLENFDPTPLDYAVTKTASWLTVSNPTGTIPGGGTATVTVSLACGANFLGHGNYNDTITFTNLTNHDGDTTRAVQLQVGVAAVKYEWKLDTNPGWAISGGQWAFGHPVGLGGSQHGYPDPNNGYTGANVYGVNLGGDYSTAQGGPYNLTTSALDCSYTTEVGLKFRRKLNSDYQPYVYATLHVSTNGTSWTQVWSNGSSEIADSAWTLQEFDLASYANNQPTVYLRWGYQIGSGAWAYSGWNIDDIELWGLSAGGPTYALGDLNCDAAVNFDDINAFVLALTDPIAYAAAYPSCNINLADCNGDCVVDFGDINAFVALLNP
jgi:gingipain R